MKRSLVYVLALAAMLTAFGLWGVNSGSRSAGAADTVSYWLPYLTTDTTSPVYCILSNMGTQSGGSGSSIDDNITTMQFTVMANAAGNPSGNVSPYVNLNAIKVNYGKSTLLSFVGRFIMADGLSAIQLTNDTGTGSLSTYGGRLDLISSTTGGTGNLSLPQWGSVATVRSAFNCSTIGLACFQGTTSPKRNLVGYSCSDSGLFNYFGATGGVYTY
ncbi:hypothetical protein [Candidatus Magnetominusculus dajiuhuensis]|uniref:hypothetical protein n=1 Tax=Candidatus Magnetominusculus dajiuhuensis TaxID=3137712 RepID=UPI003B428B8F